MVATSQCRSCGSCIIWAKTRGKKWMPLDATPSEDGNVWLYPDGTCVVTRQAHLFPEGSRHMAHWATCPNADSHRG